MQHSLLLPSTPPPQKITVNGIDYNWPSTARGGGSRGGPVVVICVDGGDPRYFNCSNSSTIMPNISSFKEKGFYREGLGVIPSFTNPNNMSIITGRPPSYHGISGNYYLDPTTKAEVMMMDPQLIRCETILERFSKAGARVVSITAKDKLRKLLGKGLQIGPHQSINFSAEKADSCSIEENGITDVLQLLQRPLPAVYSADLSLFVLEAAIKLLEVEKNIDLMYLSLTDYIQHKHGPGDRVSDDFFHQLDTAVGKLVDLGALVGITADHGMNDKSDKSGQPNVIFLQDVLDVKFGVDSTKVICPITDPYVVHHGALGGFVRVYCLSNRDGFMTAVTDFIKQLKGVEAVYDKETACKEFELPVDIEADLVVISDGPTVIGGSETKHNLAALNGERLRSHGAIADACVPLILSTQLTNPEVTKWALSEGTLLRNYNIFELILNGVTS